MRVSEVLRKARSLIDTPEKWMQGAYADSPRDPMRYCSVGAIARAAGHGLAFDPFANGCVAIVCGPSADAIEASKRASSALVDATEAGNVPLWNDAPERTHADVLLAFDRAIVATEAVEAAMEPVPAAPAEGVGVGRG